MNLETETLNIFANLLAVSFAVRGTDGTSLKKWFKAWVRNFRMKPNRYGCHTGFYDSAAKIVRYVLTEYRTVLRFASRIVWYGHSAGGGIVPIGGWILAKELRKMNICHSLAAPPSGTALWAETQFTPMHEQGLLLNTRYINPRDCVTTIFRGDDHPETDGGDVGTAITPTTGHLVSEDF